MGLRAINLRAIALKKIHDVVGSDKYYDIFVVMCGLFAWIDITLSIELSMSGILKWVEYVVLCVKDWRAHVKF